MKLFLIRGPSGTGKSTIGKYIAGPLLPVFETDQFFTYNGAYKFDVSKLKIAHRWSQLQVERQMFHGKDVVCANTFIAIWEMEHYLELAEEYKYEVEVIRSPRPWEPDVLFRRNKHNVPMDVIYRHINGYVVYPQETEWTDMSIFAPPKEDGHG